MLICGMVSTLYYRMVKLSWNRPASICYLLAWVAVELVVLCEIVEGWDVLARIDISYLTCFEESFELVFLMLFYSTNLLIAEDTDL
jgi:hypothetical protein